MTDRKSDRDPDYNPGSSLGKHVQVVHSSCRQHWQVEGSILNFTDWLMRGATDGPSSFEEPDVLEEVYAYMDEETDVLEEVDCYQSDVSE